MTEQQKIQELLDEKRHNDLIKGHGDIVAALEKVSAGEKEGTEKLASALAKQTTGISQFAESLKNLPPPEVNIELNQDKLLSSNEKLGNKILEGQQLIIEGINNLLIRANELREWNFIIDKDPGPQGRIKEVTAKQIR